MNENLLKNFLETVADRFESAELFYGHGTDNAWDEAVYLVFSTLGIDFAADDSVLSRTLQDEEVQRLQRLVDRRINERIPVAYLVGEAWFAGLPFKVDERVLIPRSPMAELVLQGFATLLPHYPDKILDLCTGSGCIGIACALRFADAQVDLADISAPALALAQENLARYELQHRVKSLQSDLFTGIANRDGGNRYDLIVCNPPYVSREEVDELPAEYRCEPELGLLSADNGLALPLQILKQAADYLSDDGVLILEVGYSHEALAQRLPEVPLMWLEFACGGEGVLVLTRPQLLAFREHFHS